MGKERGVITIPDELNDRLRHAAAESGQTPSEFALRLIEEYVGDIEDARVARDRIANLRDDPSDTVALAELMMRHGLAH